MGIIDNIKGYFTTTENKSERLEDPGGVEFAGSLIKGFIPQHLYKPPFGFPRDQDVRRNRLLGANSYIHSIVSTIQFEVSSTEWDIVPEEGEEEKPEEIKKIKRFFNNPNGNAESFPYLLRAVVKDILELDSGIFVKVFDGAGNFKQLFARDGASFYKNPDVHGYMGNRDDIIPMYYYQWDEKTKTYKTLIIQRDENDFIQLKDRAAYYQYGYNNSSMPIAFGKREVVWISANPRTDSVYGRSPLDILGAVLYTLIYGSSFNLDFYTSNNIPDGVVQLIGANKEQITAFRDRWMNTFQEKDVFNNTKKKFFSFPIVNTEAKFTPFTLSSKEMEVLSQQQWFWKITMACFGVTSSEMGFTEDSNRAVDSNQTATSRRKAIQPLLSLIEYHINTQIMPELDPQGKYRFQFVQHDIDNDIKTATLNEMYIRMGVKTPEMVAEELGIDLVRLQKEKEAAQKKEIEMNQSMQPKNSFGEQKALVQEEVPEIQEYFTNLSKELDEVLDTMPKKEDNVVQQIQ